MIKKLSVLCILIAVLISLVPLSVFADSTYSFIVPKADGNLGADSLSTTSINAYTFNNYTYNSGNTHIDKYNGHQVNSTTYPDDVYFFGVKTLVNGAQGQYYSYSIVYCVPSERVVPSGSTSYPAIRYNSTSQSTVTSTNMNTNKTLDTTTNLYYANGASSMELDTIDGRLNFPVNVNMYDSRAEGLAAVRSAIENGTTSGDGGNVSNNITINVPVNNVAYIGFANGTADISIYTGGGNKVVYSPHVSNASYWFTDTLPSGSNYASDTSGTKFIFTGRGDKTVMLGYYYAGSTLELEGVRYLVIYNPYNATNDFNFNLTVKVSNYVSCVQYPLLTNIGFNGLQSTYSDDNYYVALEAEDNTTPEYLQYNVDGQGNTTTSPAISVPQGGNNIIVNDDEDGGFDTFIEKILNLFTAPIRYIQNLVDSGSSFMAWISQLWYWLPPEVGVIIGSALAVIVVIGAIKLLWK